jgi:Zn-dependent oligopeptidase
MNWKFFHLVALLVCAAALSALAQPAAHFGSLAEFQKRAAKFKSIISMPPFETTSNQVEASVQLTITNGNAALDRVGALAPKKGTFQNTVRALDDIGYQISLTDDRLSVIKETSTNPVVRDAATYALKQLEEWSVGLDYREDVYHAVKAYADTNPKLKE